MNQATSTAAVKTIADMTLVEAQQALARATALLRDSAMYVGSKACSGGLTGEIYQFLNAHVPVEKMVQPAVAVFTTAKPAPLAVELKCGHCNVDRVQASCASKSSLCSMDGASETLAAACAA
jgi:hypothetical protein